MAWYRSARRPLSGRGGDLGCHGGRVFVNLPDDTAKIGVNAIHEEGGGIDASGDLVALDVREKISDSIDVATENATSRVQADGTKRGGTAFL